MAQISFSSLRQRVMADNGTAGAPTLSFSSDSNTGLYRPAADTVGLVTGGVERVRVNASGNVGIGTSNPQATIDCWGNVRVAGHITPLSNIEYDLGTAEKRFRDLYLSGNTIKLGEKSLSTNAVTGELEINTTVKSTQGYKVGDTDIVSSTGAIVASRLKDQIRLPTLTRSGPISTVCMYFLRADGMLFACGHNDHGQLGVGSSTATYSSVPVRPGFPCGVRFSDVVIGNRHILALSTSNKIYAWGLNDTGCVGNGLSSGEVLLPYEITPVGTVAKITASSHYPAGVSGATSFYINTAGDMYMWGARADNSGSGVYTVPTLLTRPGNNAKWKDVVTNGYTLIAVTDDTDGNKVYAIGSAANGILGNGTTTPNTTTWSAVQKASDNTQLTNVDRLYFHGGHGNSQGCAYAIDKSKNLFAWGNNTFGQIGNNGAAATAVTRAVQVLTNVEDLAISGGGHAGTHGKSVAAVVTSGQLYTWGGGDVGIGHGDTVNKLVPTAVSGMTNIAKVRGGGNLVNFYAIDVNGAVWAVGRNNDGALGIGNGTDQTTFKQVLLHEACSDVMNTYWYDGSGSYNTTYFVATSGSLYTCGDNNWWKTGTGSCVGGGIFVPQLILLPNS